MQANPRRLFAVLVVLVSALAGAWAVAQHAATFPHAVHLGQNLTCAECHDTSTDKPVLKTARCAPCHDASVTAAHVANPPRELGAFPHKRHADAYSCDDCHANVRTDAWPASKPMMGHDTCARCHESAGVAIPEADCARCHGRDMRKTAPADHAQAWRTRHGREAEWRVFDEHGRDCNACHQGATCQACHRTERPLNHTALWRERTHGQAAAFDRDRCKTCHEAGSCDNCHRDTPPLNHRGAWRALHGKSVSAGSMDTCRVCHQPARDCNACHRNQGGR